MAVSLLLSLQIHMVLLIELCVSASDLWATVARAERNGWSWLHCTACKALQNPYLWELLVSSYISHVPMQWVVEIKLADKSIAYVSQKFCSGDDVIAQGPSLGSLPGFDYKGSNRMKTWQCSSASLLLFSPSFLLKRLFLTVVWGKQSRDSVLAIKSRESSALLFYKTSCCGILHGSSRHSVVH